MKKFVVPVFTGAVVAQIWGIFSWTILPWHNLDYQSFKDDTIVTEAMVPQLQGSGIYLLPNMDETMYGDEEKTNEWNRKAQEGPFVFMSVRANGITPGMGLPMAVGFLVNLVIAFGLMWLVGKSTIACPKGRTGFIAIAGGLGGLYPIMSHWSWWHFPAFYSLAGAADLFVTWGIAGFAMVKVSDKLNS